MRHGRNDGFDQFTHIDLDRLELPPALARQIEDRRDQPVHLADRGFDKSQRLQKVPGELLVAVAEPGFGAIDGGVRDGRSRGLAQARDPLEDVAAQFVELAGEPHDVDQRRA